MLKLRFTNTGGILLLLILMITGTYAQNTDIPGELMQRYIAATKNMNDRERTVISQEMESYLGAEPVIDNVSNGKINVTVNPPGSNSDWYNSDVTVYVGGAGNGEDKQLDLKQGEDGNLYMLIPTRNPGSYKGGFRLCYSTNGGAAWSTITQVTNNAEYFFSFGMLVESRQNSNADSTRIIVYYTSSTSSNGDNAQLNVFSTRKNGTAMYGGIVSTPSAGNKYKNITVSSDGMYFESATYMHVIVSENGNSGSFAGFRHFRSINFGSTHSNALISTGAFEQKPSSAFLKSNSGSDSIYVVFEHTPDGTYSVIGSLTTTDIPSTTKNLRPYYAIIVGDYYTNPCITISQQHPSLPKKIMYTYKKNSRAYMSYSTNSGMTFTQVTNLLPNNVYYNSAVCTSDSGSTAGNNFIVACFSDNIDSMHIKRASINQMTGLTKRIFSNNNSNTIPAITVYNSGGNKYTAISYAGIGPNNAYFNSEQLVTGIQNTSGEIPAEYKLSQNYPNPFNPTTNISIKLPKEGFVKLTVFDVTGKETAVLVNENLRAGEYKVDFNASKLTSGVYFYRLEAKDFTEVKKMIVVK